MSFKANCGFRPREKGRKEESFDPGGVAGICFAMMGLIVLLRMGYDLLAWLFGWG